MFPVDTSVFLLTKPGQTVLFGVVANELRSETYIPLPRAICVLSVHAVVINMASSLLYTTHRTGWR